MISLRTLFKVSLFLVLTTVITSIFAQVKNRAGNHRMEEDFIRVSSTHPRYFETTGGKTWIPVGMNYIVGAITNLDTFTARQQFLWKPEDLTKTADEWFKELERDFKTMRENGINMLRFWGPTDFLEPEDTRIGIYNPQKFARIDSVLSIAKRNGIRIKFTLDVSRHFNPQTKIFYKRLYGKSDGGPFSTFSGYLDSELGRTLYLNRAKAFANRYKDNPTIYCWELWNEINAISDNADWFTFTKVMLDSFKLVFPHQLSAQSMGSYDRETEIEKYERYLTLANNDEICVHQYVNELEGLFPICRGPIATMVEESVRMINKKENVNPLSMNEVGAVKPGHSGPHDYLYSRDKEGVILHDFIFTPFFCGTAGSGYNWHPHYIKMHNLWYHYKRFNKAIEGFDPIEEMAVPFKMEADGINFYGLKGKKHSLIWCRDLRNDYKTELYEGKIPVERTHVILPVRCKKAKAYDPWKDKWSSPEIKNGQVMIPDFKRDIVLNILN